MFKSKKKLVDALLASEANLKLYKKSYNKLRNIMDNTPKDCKPGRYCRACLYGELTYSHVDYKDVYICTRNICKNFTTESKDK